jgi:nitrate/nitrite transporter NarK
VIASAVGPLILAESVSRTGSYAAMFYLLSVVVVVLAVLAWMVKAPGEIKPASPNL